MAGLVLEGGSLRGIFSAGAMDALLDYNIDFNYVIGVSAGISNGISYVTKQKERNIEIMRRFRNDNRYLSKRNFLRCGSIFGLDFIFDEIPNIHIPADWDAYYNSPVTVKIGMTNAQTGMCEYKDGKNMDRKCTYLRATCAIPFFFPAIKVEGQKYFDGGLADSIPIKKSIEDGNKKNLVILTQPKGFIKETSSATKIGAKAIGVKYPKLAQIMLDRANMYNETIRYIENLEKTESKNIVVLQPEFKLSSFESDIKELEKNYWHGYEVAKQNIHRIKKVSEQA